MSHGEAVAGPPGPQDRFHLDLPDGRGCSVVVGPGGARELCARWQPRWREAVLVADQTVDALHGDAVAKALAARTDRVLRCSFVAGEQSKTRQTKRALEDAMLQEGVGRDGCIVALGGGVTLDLAGFVAATYLRGIDTVYLPTTLLAQVDACLGGKTGVDTPWGKNLIGAFHHPVEVMVDPGYLDTLRPEIFRDGLAEMVKYAVIADRELFEWLEQRAGSLRSGPPIDPWALGRCLRIKARIVGEDERERGARLVLNFGHTVGHAIESATDWSVRHGEAVAMGMRVEARLATELTGLPWEAVERIDALIGALGLPGELPAVSFDDLAPYLEHDKKRAAAALRLPLPEAIGRMANSGGAWALATPLSRLRPIWEGR